GWWAAGCAPAPSDVGCGIFNRGRKMLKTLIACCLIGQAPPLPSGTDVVYDKFDDTTSIRLTLGEFDNDAGHHVLTVRASHAGRAPREAAQVFLGIARCGKGCEYLESDDVVAMVGKERVRISDQQYRSKVSGISPSPCCVFLSLAFPADELQAALEKGK